MADPAVCSFITKILCSKGGCVEYNELAREVGLPEQQLRQILEEVGPERFLMRPQRPPYSRVLAVSAVRLCVRKECEGCRRLHLCKLNLAGKCRVRSCKYSHDILSETNRKVLKENELSGLNENELRVLLLQNDPFLLPDVCNAYNKGDGNCNQQDDCPRLHVCRYFLKGECRFPRCKKSHDLLTPRALRLLQVEGVDEEMVRNIQTICDYKVTAFVQELGVASHLKPIAGHAKATGGNRGEAKHEQDFTFTPHTFLKLIPDQDIKTAYRTQPAQNTEKEKSHEKDKIDEICVHYLWRFCKNKSNCNMIHYDLPYRWQVQTGDGWKDLPKREEIEKAYSDPSTTSFLELDIDFKTMTSITGPVRRLSTASSVTKLAKFVMTTKWLWYWKNDVGQWIEYGKQDGIRQGSSLSSDDLENLFLADPTGCIQFSVSSQQYEIDFKNMTQKNVYYKTQREVRRRPKYVSAEDVKTKKGHTSAPAPASATVASSVPASNYPMTWDQSALPAVGYKAVELNKLSPEYTKIEALFQKTMTNYVIHRIRRIQNPSLWQVYQWQKEQMRKKRGGQNVEEKLLFHGTDSSSLEAICTDNFDWRICGTNGTVYGKGSYFARDAQYSHNYCQRDAKEKIMFVAQILVGDFVAGHATYNRPPAKSHYTLNCYDSCVDQMANPSIFVIFEKHQIYPAYMIHYSEKENKCILS